MKNILSLLLFSIISLSLVTAQTKQYEDRIIGRHYDEVIGVFVNSNDTRVVTSSLDETCKVWELPSGKELFALNGHLGAVYNVSFSGNDKYIATGSADRTVKIWNASNGELITTLKGHTGEVIGVFFSQDEESKFVASTSFDGTVKLWDVQLQSEVKTLRGHTGQTNNVAYSYDSKYLASCGDDKKIFIWSTDLTTKTPVKILEGHEAPVLSVLFSYDSQTLISSDQNGELKFWSMKDWTLQKTIKAHSDLIQDFSFTEDDNTIVTVSLDKFVKLWDAKTGAELYSKNIGVEGWSVDLTSNAEILIIGCADGNVMKLDVVKKSSGKSTNATKKGKK